jgi:hypothetical protein
MDYRFTFQHSKTGQLQSLTANAVDVAMRMLPAIIDKRSYWKRFDCYLGAEGLWHYVDGTCRAGKRPR